MERAENLESRMLVCDTWFCVSHFSKTYGIHDSMPSCLCRDLYVRVSSERLSNRWYMSEHCDIRNLFRFCVSRQFTLGITIHEHRFIFVHVSQYFCWIDLFRLLLYQLVMASRIFEKADLCRTLVCVFVHSHVGCDYSWWSCTAQVALRQCKEEEKSGRWWCTNHHNLCKWFE